LAVLDTIEADGLLDSVRRVGQVLADGFEALDDPLVAGHRGVGLWRALQLARPAAAAVERAAREEGFLVNAVRPDTIRLAPPLILTEDQARAFLAALPAIVSRAGGGAA
jgi:acetylornithine aminotransferase